MSYGYLYRMLEFLTGAYNRSDMRNDRHGFQLETNIGKLFSTFAWGLELIHENSDRMLLWDDIDNAEGAVLDRHGANFGVNRGDADDEFYRILIKVKMLSMLSGGDTDTVINATGSLFDIPPTEVELEDISPANIRVYVNGSLIPIERRRLVDQITPELKRILAAGIGFSLYLVYVFKSSIEVSAETTLYPYTAPFCNTKYCGTFPDYSTIGRTENIGVDASGEVHVDLYVTRLSGTYPTAKTVGKAVSSEVQIPAELRGVLDEPVFCGTITCGLSPDESTNGHTIEVALTLSGCNTEGRTSDAPLCNTKYCGQ